MKAIATKAKNKLTFPLAIISVQLIFLMVFCIFGDYDEYGQVRGEDEPADSKDDIQEYYPCELLNYSSLWRCVLI